MRVSAVRNPGNASRVPHQLMGQDGWGSGGWRGQGVRVSAVRTPW